MRDDPLLAGGEILVLLDARSFTYWSAGGVAAVVRSSHRVARSGSGTVPHPKPSKRPM